MLNDRGIKARVLFSGGKDLDILPVGAGKGNALQYILDQVTMPYKASTNLFVVETVEYISRKWRSGERRFRKRHCSF